MFIYLLFALSWNFIKYPHWKCNTLKEKFVNLSKILIEYFLCSKKVKCSIVYKISAQYVYEPNENL